MLCIFQPVSQHSRLKRRASYQTLAAIQSLFAALMGLAVDKTALNYQNVGSVRLEQGRTHWLKKKQF
jgi:hypothetical protein